MPISVVTNRNGVSVRVRIRRFILVAGMNLLLRRSQRICNYGGSDAGWVIHVSRRVASAVRLLAYLSRSVPHLSEGFISKWKSSVRQQPNHTASGGVSGGFPLAVRGRHLRPIAASL